jgi:hypothetical protein
MAPLEEMRPQSSTETDRRPMSSSMSSDSTGWPMRQTSEW